MSTCTCTHVRAHTHTHTHTRTHSILKQAGYYREAEQNYALIMEGKSSRKPRLNFSKEKFLNDSTNYRILELKEI